MARINYVALKPAAISLGLIAFVAFLPTGFHSGEQTGPVVLAQVRGPLGGNDSPIEIAGGTIHICSTKEKFNKKNSTYTVAGDNAQVYLTGVKFPSPGPATLDWSKPWKIVLSNRGAAGEKLNAVTIFPIGQNEVDFDIRGDSVWNPEATSATVLKFHDAKDCKGQHEATAACNYLMNVRIAGTDPTGKTQISVKGECLQGRCRIGIGPQGTTHCD